MKTLVFYAIVFFSFSGITLGQNLDEVSLNENWKGKIRSLAPEETSFDFKKKKKILVFSLHTGFNHWVIPHTEEMLKIISEKAEVFEVTGSKDIAWFEPENLAQFDAIVLNNTCSKPDHRNLFWDKLRETSDADSAVLMTKALELEGNISRYVKNGGGLLLIHGAITTQNNSDEFSRLVGGSFDYHPKQQKFQVRLEDSSHPLVQAFPVEGFSHIDEPYFYKNAYANLDFTPLLYFNNAEIDGQRKGQELKEGKTYVSWIRSEEKGRVMYISPSHNAQSFDDPRLLRFYLDGLQYVAGDVPLK
ncbi:ThuA domain-containing protein [Algoriphagus marinus]|uniref:ThuA domain-containing protein n=1 Tax=Algoriphagus marinus TaxID=1925762 RepID=UPI00094BBCF2|nr:ThuA domain-containing protein [Algoriphagus marinus]